MLWMSPTKKDEIIMDIKVSGRKKIIAVSSKPKRVEIISAGPPVSAPGGGVYESELPSGGAPAESTSPSPTASGAVIINGSSSIVSSSQRESSGSCPSTSSATGSSSSSPPVFTIVPVGALHNTGTRVVTSSAGSIASATSSDAGTKSIVPTTETTQIVVVSEADDSSPGETVGSVNLGVGGTYVQAYPIYTLGDTTMYAASGTYYTTPSTSPGTFSQVVVNSSVTSQIMSSASNAYLLPQDVENDQQAIINNTRHSSQTVHWLLDNYETAEGVSLPRSTLYNHYLHHCADNNLDPVNSATFGKLIRSVFMGLRTRRLGTRGNSKYHYYGIRIKPTSPLNHLSEDGSSFSARNVSSSLNKKYASQVNQSSNVSHHSSQGKGVASSTSGSCGKSNENYDSHGPSSEASQTVESQQYIGDVSRVIPDFPEISDTDLPPSLTKQHFQLFSSLYRQHCESILDAVATLQFHQIENIWRRFWSLGNNNNSGILSEEKNNLASNHEDEEGGELASRLPSNVFHVLLQSHHIINFVKSIDYQFYQNLVEVLIPDVLRITPSSLTQAIRNFAKSSKGWLITALTGYPQAFFQAKVNVISSLAQTLRRYTSLNHLAQAARAVLQNECQISQMLTDLSNVDFHNVQEQASWVCQCDDGVVERLEDFKITLQQQNSLEQWAEWLQAVVAKVLEPHEGKPDFTKHARQFLLKWSFYSSMVIRDLTLRSAASFGSFHLIRLLYDEYMFYLIEHRVASSLGLTPIAVMSQYLGDHRANDNMVLPVSMAGYRRNSSMKTDDGPPSPKRVKFEES